MTHTEEDRPDCKAGCGKRAALSRGELAYKGFCSGCYKADVEARRAAKAHDHTEFTEGCFRCDLSRAEVEQQGQGALPEVGDGGAGDAVLPPGEGEADAAGDDHGPDGEPGAGPRGPRGRKRVPLSCGWCLDGNHLPRADEPDFEDEAGVWRRGRPGTIGCAAGQYYLSGPMAGLPKGLSCACHAAGHDRSAIPGAE